MKTVVVYNSQTGFTKRYAQWIAEAVGADCMPLKDAQKADMTPYDAIVFGGWALGGSINKIGWFAEHVEAWAGKKLAVFCVGASPAENSDVEKALEEHFKEPRLQNVPVFYCPGGLDYSKMDLPYKLMMKMFTKMLNGQKEKTPEEQERAQMLATSYDISDKKYIEPIVACLNQ